MIKNSKLSGNNPVFDDGEPMINEETQDLFNELTGLLAEYEHKTGRGIVMNLGVYSRDRKRGTNATYAHMTDAAFCDHCDELHAMPAIVPGSDLDPLLTCRNQDESNEMLNSATEEQMYTDPWGKKYLIYHGVMVRRNENGWEQIPPRDADGQEYTQFLKGKSEFEPAPVDGQDVTQVTSDFDDVEFAAAGKFISQGSKTLN